MKYRPVFLALTLILFAFAMGYGERSKGLKSGLRRRSAHR